MYLFLKQNKRTKTIIEELTKLDSNLTTRHYDYLVAVESSNGALQSYVDCGRTKFLKVWKAGCEKQTKPLIINLRDISVIYDL